MIKEYILIKDDNNHPVLKEKKNIDYEKDIINDLDELCAIMCNEYDLDISLIEYSYIIAVSNQNRILGIMELGKGTTLKVENGIKEAFMFLILCGAEKFIHIHNHPESIIMECSLGDVSIKNRFKEVGMLLDIPLWEALIITEQDNIRYTDM